MALEKNVKDLQAQNAQFQETLLNLAKGKQEMMVLLTKEKKTKKQVVILNMGRRFKGHSQPVQVGDISFEEDDNQEEDVRSTRPEGGNNQGSEDEDYSDEQYPHADDKYKQLEDRLKAMEI